MWISLEQEKIAKLPFAASPNSIVDFIEDLKLEKEQLLLAPNEVQMGKNVDECDDLVRIVVFTCYEQTHQSKWLFFAANIRSIKHPLEQFYADLLNLGSKVIFTAKC